MLMALIEYSQRLTVTLAIVAWSASTAHAASGDIYNLGTLGGTYSAGLGINAAGQVVGRTESPAGIERAFLYSGTPGSGGAMVDLGTLGGSSSQALAINNAGQITGSAETPNPNSVHHAFLYTGTPGTGGSMADLAHSLGRQRLLVWALTTLGKSWEKAMMGWARLPLHRLAR